MDRRSFILKAGAATGGALAVASLAAPAIAQDRRELRLLMPWPVGFPGLGTAVDRLAARIAALSDGRYTIAATTAATTLEIFDRVSAGEAEFYHAPDYYFAGRHSAFNFFTAAPLGLTFAEHTAWIHFGGGQALWDELAAGFNLKPLLAGNTGAQMGGWFKNAIANLGDLQGLSFRMPGLGAEVWRQLGVNVVSMPGREILAALQSDAIDGADWVGPWNDLELGLHRAAKNYYYPSLVEGGAAVTLGLNKTFWDGLSDSDKALFSAAAATDNAWMYGEFTYQNGIALKALTSEHGVTVRPFPADIIAEIGEVAPEVMSLAAANDIGRRVLASYLEARETMRGWSAISEPEYLAAREEILG